MKNLLLFVVFITINVSAFSRKNIHELKVNNTSLILEKMLRDTIKKEEAVRLMVKSPKWKPVIKNGRNIIFRQKRSITFMVN